MVRGRRPTEVTRREFDTGIHVDGQGPARPSGTWKSMHQDAAAVAGWGWKNLLDEDSPLLALLQTLTHITPL